MLNKIIFGGGDVICQTVMERVQEKGVQDLPRRKVEGRREIVIKWENFLNGGMSGQRIKH